MTVIVDEWAEVVESMRNLSAADALKFGVPAGLESPYYFYGHPMDINRQMMIRDKEEPGKVYPAVCLRLPIEEDMGSGMIHYTLNAAIFANTNLDWDASERYANVIKPTLLPLYELLLDRLRRHGFTMPVGQRSYPHKKIDRPHHGILETQGNKAYPFTNKLDAIELVDLKLNFKIKQC